MNAIPMLDSAPAVQAPAETAGKATAQAEGESSFAEVLTSVQEEGKAESKDAEGTEGTGEAQVKTETPQPAVLTEAQAILALQELLARSQVAQVPEVATVPAGSAEVEGVTAVGETDPSAKPQSQGVAGVPAQETAATPVSDAMPVESQMQPPTQVGNSSGADSAAPAAANQSARAPVAGVAGAMAFETPVVETVDGRAGPQAPVVGAEEQEDTVTVGQKPAVAEAAKQSKEQSGPEVTIGMDKQTQPSKAQEPNPESNDGKTISGAQNKQAVSQMSGSKSSSANSGESGLPSKQGEEVATAKLDSVSNASAPNQVGAFKVEAGLHVDAKSAVAGAQQDSKADDLDIVQQVVRQAELFIKDGKTGLTIQLHPAHLGKLSLSVLSTEAGVSLQVMAENRQAHELLQANMAGLQTAFHDRGITLDRVSVQVGGYMDQSGSAAKGQPGWSNSGSPYAHLGQGGNRLGGSLLETASPWLEDRLVDLRV